MAVERPLFEVSKPAGADLSTHQYKAITVNSSGQMILATALGQRIDGILQDKPDAAGVGGTYMKAGICIVEAGAAFSIGDELTSAADGQLVERTSDEQYYAGTAMEAAAAAGDQVTAILWPGGGDPSLAVAADGRAKMGLLRATYDFAVDGGAVGVITLGETLPNNAICTNGFIDVITTLTSAADTATIAVGIATDDAAGIRAAVAINSGTSWDAGYQAIIQDSGAVANHTVKTAAADRAIIVTVAVQAVTAGKFITFLEYVISD